MILSFRTYTCKSGQTVQTQVRLLLEQQSDQGLHCLQFPLHLLDALLYGKATLFRMITTNFSGVRIFRSFTVKDGKQGCQFYQFDNVYLVINKGFMKFINLVCTIWFYFAFCHFIQSVYLIVALSVWLFFWWGRGGLWKRVKKEFYWWWLRYMCVLCTHRNIQITFVIKSNIELYQR